MSDNATVSRAEFDELKQRFARLEKLLNFRIQPVSHSQRLEIIKRIVARVFEVDVAWLGAKSRRPSLRNPRFVFWLLAFDCSGLSQREIAAVLGFAVMSIHYGVHEINALMRNDSALRAKVALAREHVATALAKLDRGEAVMPGADGKVSFERIKEVVCERYRLSEEALLSKAQTQEIVWPRNAVVHLALKITGMNLSAVGRELNRKHGTIEHARASVKDRMSVDPTYRREVELLEAMFV